MRWYAEQRNMTIETTLFMVQYIPDLRNKSQNSHMNNKNF